MIRHPAVVSADVVTLAQRLNDLPSADQFGREGHQISLGDFHRLTALRRDDCAAFEDIAGFILEILPRKLGSPLLPFWPVVHPQAGEASCIGCGLDDDLGHAGLPDCVMPFV